jgi:hypothetical protein
MRLWPVAALAFCGLGLARELDAQEREPPKNDTAPDLEFLEYLGSWQASDEEWFEGSPDRKKPEPERPRDEHEKPK